VQGGALIEHDYFARLAEMRADDATRCYVHGRLLPIIRAGWARPRRCRGWQASGMKNCHLTTEIHGGHGYMKEFAGEAADAAAFLHSDGVNRTLFLKAANFMFND
jgi:hypothetical protein